MRRGARRFCASPRIVVALPDVLSSSRSAASSRHCRPSSCLKTCASCWRCRYAIRRLFYARFVKTVLQSSSMIVVFLLPVLFGVGIARCAPCMFYLTALLTVAPFCVIPVAAGTGTTMLLVNVFPARRARDILMLMSLVFAGSIVLLLRFVQPERLLRGRSPARRDRFLRHPRSPITPMLPSFWAGETLFASLIGGRDLLHAGALWTTACAFTVLLSAASERWYFSGFSKSQDVRKARFTKLEALDGDRARAAAVGRSTQPSRRGRQGFPTRRHAVVGCCCCWHWWRSTSITSACSISTASRIWPAWSRISMRS